MSRPCVYRRVHIDERSQSAYETYKTFNYPNTPFDTKSFNNAHDIGKNRNATRASKRVPTGPYLG